MLQFIRILITLKLFLWASLLLGQSTGSLNFLIKDETDNEPVVFCHAKFLQEGILTKESVTDFDGKMSVLFQSLKTKHIQLSIPRQVAWSDDSKYLYSSFDTIINIDSLIDRKIEIHLSREETNIETSFGVEKRPIIYNINPILMKIDSLLTADSVNGIPHTLESAFIGKSFVPSKKYMLYKELLEYTSLNDLYRLIGDTNLKPPIRAYAYMAYIYHIDKNKLQEKTTDYNFAIHIKIGCVYKTLDFQDFKSFMRLESLNNPYLQRPKENCK